MLEKMSGESLDITKENIEKLKEIFPEVVSEGKVDFDKLKDIFTRVDPDDIAPDERYNFTWSGKRRSIHIAQHPSKGTLLPVKEKSKNRGMTKNLYIEGDNLEVLKLLQKSYFQKVKMIYIDPPYNTGKDFVYHDNFHDSYDNYLKQTGQIDSEGRATTTNKETNGRFHADWLNMMFPRLKLARNLLTEDGLIFVSIDENELSNLLLIMNEIFGETNYVDNIIWKKRYGGGAKEKYLVTLQEYVVMFAKNIEKIDELFVPLNDESVKRYYSKRDEKYDIRGGYRTHPLEATKSMDPRPNLVYPIPAPDGTQIIPKRQWLWSKDRAYEALKNNDLEIVQGKDGKWTVSTKQYERDENGNRRPDKMFSIIEDVYTQHGTNEMINLFGNAKIFSFPKPTALIRNLLKVGSEKDSLILDFFSGSATTADAIMQQNAEDGGSRKCIMVQLPELLDENSEAYKTGYRTICDIGEERIRRAGEKIKGELIEKRNKEGMLSETMNPDDLDIGFKVFKLDRSNIKEWYADFDQMDKQLDLFENNFVKGRSEEDIVYEIMLKNGLDLNYPIEKISFHGKNIFKIAYGALFICLDEQVTVDIANKLIELKNELNPEKTRVVFKDLGFKNDQIKINVYETLKANGFDELMSI